MLQGFYNLASGMATQNKNMNVISNNMANVSTPGYKSDAMTATTFQQEMFYRTGNQDRGAAAQLGPINMIKVPGETITDYTDGTYTPTDSNLDCAINGKGFFKVATPTGIVYTRNGSFSVDEEGCLFLRDIGRVQGTGGDITVETDRISVDALGGIYSEEGDLVDNLSIVDFADYAAMTKNANGTFDSAGAEIELEAPNVYSKTLELANVEPMEEMKNMIATQRAIQGSSQILKMYDQLMTKAVTEIGRV
ncbi:MAG: flagellar hook-basal body protein [Hungatella sp.]